MSKGLVGRARWRDAMRVTSGGLLATSLALLAAVLIADVNVVETAQRNVSRYHAEVLDDRVVRVDTVPAHNGDIVRVWPQWDLPGQAFATHEAWVLPGGTGLASALRGTLSADALEGVAGMPAQAWSDEEPLTVRGTGPEGLDIVRVFHFATGTTRPGDGEARTYFDALVLLQTAGAPDDLVLQEKAIRFHAVARVATWASAVTSLAAFAWWGWTLWREARRPEAAEPTAALVDLVASGGRYLARMRALALGLLLPVGLLAWFMLAFLANSASSLVAPSGSWLAGLALGIIVLVGTLGAALLVLAGAVHARHREWKDAFARGPWSE